AAALQQGSEHPLALAVLDAARDRGPLPPPAAGVTALRGLGVEGRVDGRRLLLGSGPPMRQSRLAPGPSAGPGEAEAARGHSVSWLAMEADDGLRLLGLLAFGDPPRPEAAEAVAALRGMGIRPVMLSGDNAGAARAVAAAVGIAAE